MKTKQSMLYKRVQELNLHLTELLILGLLMCQQSLLVKLKVSVEWLMAKQTTTLVSVVIQLILAISSSTGLLIHYVLIFMLKPALHHLQNVLSISKKCQPKVLLQLDNSEFIDACSRYIWPKGNNVPLSWPGCSVFSAFANKAAKSGTCTNWRSEKFCSYTNKCRFGTTFSACGPNVPKTCENYKTYSTLNVAYDTEG